ncbi:MAG: RdgB/HAM1 family non-canonical purine NTP pyrophosphatase [Candidatus Cloacimonetes bacterium]|nr:RdgB/HAM1 family non-canonical purine NTP pyrophosphatase [Candidatus Cloacimonadota bacterium]
MKLLLATRNRDKISEILALLADLDLQIFTAFDFNDLPEVIEDRETLADNAAKKAWECSVHTGIITLADDTGLFVDALQGAPGVYSARFAGENCTYQDNRLKLLKVLEGNSNRRAFFRTVAVLASPDRIIGLAEGEVNGQITEVEMGEFGFGYDAVFRVDETGKTLAQMTEEDKNKISHRGRAIQKLIPILKKMK